MVVCGARAVCLKTTIFLQLMYLFFTWSVVKIHKSAKGTKVKGESFITQHVPGILVTSRCTTVQGRLACERRLVPGTRIVPGTEPRLVYMDSGYQVDEQW